MSSHCDETEVRRGVAQWDGEGQLLHKYIRKERIYFDKKNGKNIYSQGTSSIFLVVS